MCQHWIQLVQGLHRAHRRAPDGQLRQVHHRRRGVACTGYTMSEYSAQEEEEAKEEEEEVMNWV